MRIPARILTLAVIYPQYAAPVPVNSPYERQTHGECRQVSVAILGAGVAGIIAAQTLHNNSIDDFVIVDRNDYIGGRLHHTSFGKDPKGKPYTIELGANWIQGVGHTGGSENPIWTLAQKWGVVNHTSNYSSILTYDEHGFSNYADLLEDWDNAYQVAAAEAAEILLENLQDTNMRVALSQGGWKPGLNMTKQAVDYWKWDWENAVPPEESSFVFGVAGGNASFVQWGTDNNLSIDQRGYNYWLASEAGEFLQVNDSRLLLSTVVTNVQYDQSHVIVHLDSGDCIEAQYAICTFALGVLQNDAVKFEPSFPRWKRSAIDEFQMNIYTKIFFQFNTTFWDPNTQFFLYADPVKRGYYPLWQSLSTPGFFPGSNIIFATVTDDESRRIERQDREVTKQEALGVLRKMFPHEKIPEPMAFTFPSWESTNWTYGSYSSWPPGMTLEKHQNLRANVSRLWFAGEAGSAEYFGFLQGAYYEGLDVGGRISGLLNEAHVVSNSSTECQVGGPCGPLQHYDKLSGTTPVSEFTIINGWMTALSRLGMMRKRDFMPAWR